MNVFRHVDAAVREALAAVLGGTGPARFSVELPREAGHGDFATNAAMAAAKGAGRKPRELADELAARLAAAAEVARAEVAGPGFVNLRMEPGFWRARLPEMLEAGTAYGDSGVGNGQRVNVEYVSANPTGPLHVGHGRGAVFGDALASLLAKAGFAVTKEYYINDAGGQIDALAESLLWRIRHGRGAVSGPMPEDLYPGDYLIPVAEALAAEFPDAEPDAAMLRERGVGAMMALIREDLGALGIRQDVFRSERALAESGAIGRAVDALDAKGLVHYGELAPPKGRTPEDWEPGRRQHLFRSTCFGDDVDRPLRKSDGSWTYFASDIAYHADKVERGFADMINVWGADHGGYVKRMAAAVAALTDGTGRLDIRLCQLVRVLRAGRLVRMSKRSGDFVGLREVVDEVGRDVVRFIMLTRRNDAPLDFDLSAAVVQSRDNPVFYVQYAHARARSVIRHAGGIAAPTGADLEALDDPDELALIRRLAAWPHIVETAALAHEPHRVAFYLQELATDFHGLWTKGRDNARLRFLQDDDPGGTRARLALVRATAAVVASGLAVVGVEPAEEM